MTRLKGPQTLPTVVTLPDAPTMAAEHVRTALNVSRSLQSLWRKRYGFPRSHREGHRYLTLTADVRDWLEARGVRVTVL